MVTAKPLIVIEFWNRETSGAWSINATRETLVVQRRGRARTVGTVRERRVTRKALEAEGWTLARTV